VADQALRLDKWLWFTRLTKSRSLAQALCESRHIRLNGKVVERSSTQVKPGQVLTLPFGEKVKVLRVEALPARRGPYVEACRAYTELTPVFG
jgi:ribosome-associated heat shock protein Hsp15